jgi:hypothetical protein
MDQPPRTPWASGFPDVAIHTSEEMRNAHSAYTAAKAGDPEAATTLVADLIDVGAVEVIAAIVGGRPAILVPASAIEKQGFNAIPDALAYEIARRLNLDADTQNINQINIVSHTRANGFHRLANPARFDGAVEPGRPYVIVDDHVGLGGTIASLKGHIEGRNGLVIAATCLTESPRSRHIALSAVTLDALRRTHGDELERYWRQQAGHGLDALTEPEAGYLLRAKSLDRIRNQMAKAAAAGCSGRTPQAL